MWVSAGYAYKGAEIIDRWVLHILGEMLIGRGNLRVKSVHDRAVSLMRKYNIKQQESMVSG